MYKGTTIRLSAGFSPESFQNRMEWHSCAEFKVLKEKTEHFSQEYQAEL